VELVRRDLSNCNYSRDVRYKVHTRYNIACYIIVYILYMFSVFFPRSDGWVLIVAERLPKIYIEKYLKVRHFETHSIVLIMSVL